MLRHLLLMLSTTATLALAAGMAHADSTVRADQQPTASTQTAAPAVEPLRALALSIATDPSLNPRLDSRSKPAAGERALDSLFDWGIWVMVYVAISLLAVSLFGSIAAAGDLERLGPAAASQMRRRHTPLDTRLAAMPVLTTGAESQGAVKPFARNSALPAPVVRY